MHSSQRYHFNRKQKPQKHQKHQNNQPPAAAPTRSSPIISRSRKENQQQRQVATQDLAPESASRALPRSNESTTHDPNQYRDIRKFLESTKPLMTHLMDAFIDFGCINTDFLLTISSWSSEKIRNFLDQLSLGPGRQITEMDKFILENHFKEYFT